MKKLDLSRMDIEEKNKSSEIIQNIIVGLTVSFVAISLGAAFGVQSGRGAFAGIMSAGIIALVCSLLGGTRIQCSGPTAPMTAFVISIAAIKSIDNNDHFLNLIFILTGLILILAGLLRFGKLIKYIPKVVLSGFMNGIAILIWIYEIQKLFGLADKKALTGSATANLLIALFTLIMLFVLPPVIKKVLKAKAAFLPATLLSIVVMSLVANMGSLDIEKVVLGTSLNSFADFTTLIKSQIPVDWSFEVIKLALPFALGLSLLAYLDTLLTSLVVDKIQEENGHDDKTKQNKELMAQGVANGLIAFIGGIPGAQATIRSVLMLKENATMRLAGIMVGVFVLIEMLLFQNYISLIPKAVFAGLLIKVGYDVFDWEPFWKYLSQHFKIGQNISDGFKTSYLVTHMDMFFIVGTSLVTALYSLNIAVIVFTLLFYIFKRFTTVPDLKGPEKDDEKDDNPAEEIKSVSE
ncbi:MAG: SulP family inorganic anion transporter [Lentisphaeria bacterium]|nr:SulP family inorganic anion transporter [Lentisphaeria bacterium]NQZ69534.1 SulP family inorganic anion transporter [Lentisphaeria bacterium]